MARRTRFLVQNHLENISRKTVERYLDELIEHVHGRHGIYALYRDSQLYYVGLASSLGHRLRQHLKDRHAGSWNRFSVYITAANEHIRELEALAHRIVRPEGNKQFGKLGGSVDLRRALQQQMKRRHEIERDELFGDRVRAPRANGGHARTPSPSRQRPVRSRSPTRVGGPPPFTLGKRVRIRAVHKGVEYSAFLMPDGRVLCNGKEFTSVSHAARSLLKRRACNGKYFWRAKVRSGEWVRLRELK